MHIVDNTEHNAATEAKIDHIASLMRSLKWRTGETGKVLAAEWDLTEKWVRELAAEASRRVYAEITDPHRVTVTVCTTLEKIVREADAEGDRKSAIDAAKAWADISGARAPNQVRLTGPGGGPLQSIDVTKLTDEQLDRLTRGQLPALESASGDGAEEAGSADGAASGLHSADHAAVGEAGASQGDRKPL